MGYKLTTEEFIEQAIKVHGNKYDYSKVKYINNKTKVEIICSKHGSFWQRPNCHIFKKHGCPKCSLINRSIKNRSNRDEFIKKAIKIHGNKYDYSKVEYINCRTKVEIICPEHGSFWQTPNNHISQQHNCPKCKYINQTYTTDKFILLAKQIHNNKYDYSKVNYINNKIKIEIVCPIHGSFWQIPRNHLIGRGCPKCSHNISKYEDEICEFIKNNITSNIIRNSRQIISPYELDIYLPEYNFAIEFNGEYWHSWKFINPINKHQNKIKLCEDKNIYLLHIPESDFIKWKKDYFEEIKCLCKNKKAAS